MHVRLANPSDEDAVVAYLSRLADQWGLRMADGSSFPFHEHRARPVVRNALAQRDAWIAVIGETEIEAAIGLEMNRPFFSDAPFISDLFTTVAPAFRDKGHFNALIEFAKSVAHAAGLPLVLGVIANDRVEAKRRLFTMKMGQPSGSFYVYQPKSGAREIAA